MNGLIGIDSTRNNVFPWTDILPEKKEVGMDTGRETAPSRQVIPGQMRYSR